MTELPLNSTNEEVLMTPEDLARRWRCSLSKIRNARPSDLPPRIRLPGRLVRFRQEDVEEFEAGCRR